MRRLFLLFIMALAAVLVSVVTAQTTLSGTDLDRIRSATVFVMQARNLGDNLVVTCVGTGTLVNRSGLILTNAHNTVQSADCPGDALIIALNIRSDEPPVPKYRAEIAQADAGLDLALLRITRESDGRLVDRGALALPFVELADSQSVKLDDTITVVGYPGIGNDIVSVERGTITGFTAEPSGGVKSWIKTSAALKGTMSGGGAYNQDGKLIGIPTTAPITAQSPGAVCQPIQDTNGDGLVNNNDVCIPVGGFINSLRPSNFARPLFKAASLGLSVEVLTPSAVQKPAVGTPTFRRLFFSPSVADGMPTSVVQSVPAGTTSLYLFFDYENMTPETVYELRVTINGIPNPIFSLAPVRWSGGERGLWYIGSSDQPWPNGVYEFTLLANGLASETKRLVIGAPPSSGPAFSSVVFGLQDQRGEILGNSYVLASGNTAAARFIYQNMKNGTPWTAIWYYNGSVIFRTADGNAWSDGESGAKTISVQDPRGLPPGNYRLELYIATNLAATADFAIAGAQQGPFPQVFTDVHFANARSAQDALNANPVSTFPNTVSAIYALFNWQQITPGTLWTLRWLVDGDVLYERTVPWSGADTGEKFLVRLSSATTIPDGTYQMDLLVNGFRLSSAKAQLGIGQLPIDRFAQASGAQMRGQILDADTHQGIPGVTFVLISKEFSIQDFTWDQSQVFDQALTDRNGRFEISRPLELSVPYSVIIVAQGYLPITADGVEIKPDTPTPINMTIYLIRD